MWYLHAAAAALYLEILVYCLTYFINVIAGSAFVTLVLGRLDFTEEQKKKLEGQGLKGAGMIIGMLERTLVLTLMFLGQPTAIAMVFVAKSIIRFEESKERAFAEYYLVGTMSSIIFAMFMGMASNFILDTLTGWVVCL